LYCEGEGGARLGELGHSKDFRPQLNQMIVAIIMDQTGRPVGSEMWPGNTADVTTLMPVVDRLRDRFGIGRVCVVADRGMISAATIAALEQRDLEYILGVRERRSKEVRDVVLADPQPSAPLTIPRQGRPDTELQAKEVMHDGRRYIVCRNRLEAEQDARNRETVVASLRAKLKQGDKSLLGNSAYRRYLRTPDEQPFIIDEARIADEARYDGLSVLRTNTRLHPLQAMMRYRALLVVEQMFRSHKALLETRPIFHQTDEAIRGHVFCTFLALVLRKELEDRLAVAQVKPEWRVLLTDLDRLQEIAVEQDGKRFILRTPVTGVAGKVFQAVGVALPPQIRDAKPAAAA
jgi:transposase